MSGIASALGKAGLGLGLILASVPAAQSQAPLSPPETLLNLSETATVMVAPDELAATLRADAASSQGTDAQNRVNVLIRDALSRVRQDAGIVVSTGAYSVWRGPTSAQDRTERWYASQSLNLTGKDGTAMLSLVGDLQQRGLVISGLGWRLSRETQRKAYQDATRQALSALRGRIDEAATLLDLRFDRFKNIHLDSAMPVPMLRAAAAPMAAATRDVAPSSAAEEQPVSATAQAEAVLVPR